MHDRIAGRRLRVAVFDARAGKEVARGIFFPPGVDLVVGREEGANLRVDSWMGPNAVILSGGHLLHLGPGMRLHMCHDDGEDRVLGEYEELTAKGTTFPLALNVSKLNVRIQSGISLFMAYLREDQPDWNPETEESR